MAWVGTFLTRRGREDGIITATQRDFSRTNGESPRHPGHHPPQKFTKKCCNYGPCVNEPSFLPLPLVPSCPLPPSHLLFFWPLPPPPIPFNPPPPPPPPPPVPSTQPPPPLPPPPHTNEPLPRGTKQRGIETPGAPFKTVLLPPRNGTTLMPGGKLWVVWPRKLLLC